MRRTTAEETPMPTLVTLEYPNGRIHETQVPEDLKPGAQFELYGRRWWAVGHSRPSHARQYMAGGRMRLLCRPAA